MAGKDRAADDLGAPNARPTGPAGRPRRAGLLNHEIDSRRGLAAVQHPDGNLVRFHIDAGFVDDRQGPVGHDDFKIGSGRRRLDADPVEFVVTGGRALRDRGLWSRPDRQMVSSSTT